MYKTFEFSFPGVWLGGIGIVQAKTPEEARRLAEIAVADAGFDATGIELTQHDTKGKAVILWNGDY